jgi:hypothetical protein
MRAVRAVAFTAMLLMAAWGASDTARSQPAPPAASPPAAAHFVPSVAGRAPLSDPNANIYNYVYGFSQEAATGASVMLPQSQPRLAANAGHSLIELAVESGTGQQIVEVGWVVGEDNGTLPKLFVFYWKDGHPTCYDTCGFVPLHNAIKPGAVVAKRQAEEYGITFSAGRWWVSYENKRIGFFPASLWEGRFTKAGLIQTFGEITATSNTTCTQMGNGRFGSNPKADEISGFQLKGTSASSRLTLKVTLRKAWNAGSVSGTAFRLGGPGTC